jgi:hypothetical protein
METITIENDGLQAITCSEVTQDEIPVSTQPVVIEPRHKAVVYTGSQSGTIRIKVGVANHKSYEQIQKQDRLTMPKPKLY